jgi:hypothetical protein
LATGAAGFWESSGVAVIEARKASTNRDRIEGSRWGGAYVK